MEQRLADLETRIAFQDEELQTLNNVLVDQQKQIDTLAGQVRVLQDKLQDMKTSSLIPESEEKPPPHY